MATKFAFYGRVSTEDMQDETSSKQWQLARAEAILPKGARIVREYFDVGQSRSLPWKRRPKSAALLDDLKDPRRGFDAVVIGEPARAFYGSQFALTFPVMTHHNVELWVPEVGGKVDPGSDAHDLVMSLYGGMSKGERNRIKLRVRTAMTEQARHQGRFLGGRPPYGYVLADAGPHPNPAKAGHGQRLRTLEVDPTAAPIVVRIFEQYVDGIGLGSVAEGLNRDGVPSPSGHDPARNRHRESANGAWSKSAIRAILQNPKYTGRSVWNRQRRDEELLDVDDVAAGYETKMRWNDKSEWVWSSEPTHEAIISPELFEAAAAQRRLGEQRNTPSRPRRKRTYCLSSLLVCGICGRRMNGSWNHDAAHYRCGFPAEYAGATNKHTNWVYLRESIVTEALDEWLHGVFDPKNLDALVAALAAAQTPNDAATARAEAARRTIAECDRKLANLRKQIEGGDPPGIVLTWIREAEAERFAAERELTVRADAAPLTDAELRALVKVVRKVLRGLSSATPEQRRDAYAMLGLTLTYDPDSDSVDVEVRPDACTRVCVGGGT